VSLLHALLVVDESCHERVLSSFSGGISLVDLGDRLDSVLVLLFSHSFDEVFVQEILSFLIKLIILSLHLLSELGILLESLLNLKILLREFDSQDVTEVGESVFKFFDLKSGGKITNNNSSLIIRFLHS